MIKQIANHNTLKYESNWIKAIINGNAVEIIESVDLIKASPQWRKYFIDFEFPYRFYGTDEYKNLIDEAGLKEIYIKLIRICLFHI